jgi:GLPGLI family protein
MKKIILTFSILAFTVSSLSAQNAKFIRSGVITYKKTVNMYAIIQRGINKENEGILKPAFETYKQQHPQLKELNSNLMFGNNQTLFTPSGNNTPATSFFNDPQISMQKNVVYTNLDTKQLVSEKKIFDDTYLLKDTLKSIKWKFTDEIRDIAGYPCHRANGIVLDSVYVVAFYTDKIPVSGGPESFSGLPGMILQLALPHENVSWVATKVDDINLPANSIVAPARGKIVNYKQLMDKLMDVYKGSSKSKTAELKAFLL